MGPAASPISQAISLGRGMQTEHFRAMLLSRRAWALKQHDSSQIYYFLLFSSTTGKDLCCVNSKLTSSEVADTAARAATVHASLFCIATRSSEAHSLLCSSMVWSPWPTVPSAFST